VLTIIKLKKIKNKMDPVRIGSNLDIINMDAAYIIPMGAAVVRTAAGTVRAATTANDNDIIGIADMSEVEQAVPGFWAQYKTIPVIVGGGRVQVWVIANGNAVNIEAGDFLEVGDFGSTPGATDSHGILEEAGTRAGGTRTTHSVAKALEDKTMGSDSYQNPDAVAIGDTTVTLSSAEVTALNLSDGDHILLEDVTDNFQVNARKTSTSTVITLVKASTVALDGSTDECTRMFQVEAVLL